MTFWEDSQKYLYLPRLKNLRTLSQAIQTGSASRDFFGTAYGRTGETFEGFQLGGGGVQVDDTLLLIEPGAAKEYEEGLKRLDQGVDGRDAGHLDGSTPEGTSNTGVAAGSRSGAAGAGIGVVGGPPSVAAKAKSFHGSVQINPSTAKMRLVEIAEEILGVLASDPNCSLDITLEIHAEFPAGAPDQIKRAVSENAASLGFKTKSWE
jgi:hypothetical protein